MAKLSLAGMSGLGPGPDSSEACGESPCGFTDYIYLSDGCMDYLGCADPTNKLYVGAKKGGLYVVGQAAGEAITETLGGVGDGVKESTGIPGTALLLAAAAVVLFVLKR